MKILTILATIMFLVGQVFAQAPLISVGTVTGSASSAVDLPVSFTPGILPVTALQFDLTLPAGLSYVSASTGAAATAAGKNISSSATGSLVRIIVFGLNQNPIGPGVLTAVNLTIALSVVSGSKPVGISGIVAPDKDGKDVPTTGMPGTVIIPSAILLAPTDVRVK